MSTLALLPEDLAQRIADGDIEAETALMERYRPGLLALLRHRCWDRGEVEDLCHETLKAALEGLRAGRLRDHACLSAYIRGIAENLVRRGRRRLRREVGQGDELPERSDPAPGPEDGLIREERRRRVRATLDKLSPRDRTVLREFYLGEIDKSAICVDMGLAPDHFDLIKHRALKRFARWWEVLTGGGERELSVAG